MWWIFERKQLTAGTTWHAAGLVTTACHSSETIVSMAKYTRDLYTRLEAETGQATGFMPVGYIQLATSQARLEELRRTADFVRAFGIQSDEIPASEIKGAGPWFPRTG